jgi:hypothetical protein
LISFNRREIKIILGNKLQKGTLMNKISQMLLLNLLVPISAGNLFHYYPSQKEKGEKCFIWQLENIPAFNELLISWNAQRPQEGAYSIQVSILTMHWSEWLNYALWGQDIQHTYKNVDDHSCARVSLSAVSTMNKQKAYGFRIRVKVQDKASLKTFRALHVCATDTSFHKVDDTYEKCEFISLDVPPISQMTILDKCKTRMCSPTSTTAVIRYLTKSSLNPLIFADKSYDCAFDLYGNWVLNSAQAACELEGEWNCLVARFNTFDQIIKQLQKGYPVVTSIQGPLKGGALPYESGHLLVVKGFNPEEKKVLCMDPAFESDELTLVEYDLKDFVQAWNKRLGLSYIFFRS